MTLKELMNNMELGQKARRRTWGTKYRSYVLDEKTGNFVPDFYHLPYEELAELKKNGLNILITVKFTKEDIEAEDWFVEAS